MDSQGSPVSDRLSSLSRNDVSEPPSYQDEDEDCPEMTIPTGDFSDQEGELLRQRCVIVQRDEKGYGLTVSGDNPVFVQSVKKDGAATVAGVQQGDRIIKVNGTGVTQSNHLEVVKLIRSGSYVALTLLGRPPGNQNRHSVPSGSVQLGTSPTGFNVNSQQPFNMTSTAANNKPSSPSERVTAPQPVDAEKQQELTNSRIHTFRMMLEQELKNIDELRSLQIKNPSCKKINTDLNGACKRMKTLQEQLFNLTGVHYEQSSSSYCPKSPSFCRSSATEKDYQPFHPHLQHHHSESSNIGSSKGNILTHQISAPTPLKSCDVTCFENSDSFKKPSHHRNSSVQIPPLPHSPEKRKWRNQSAQRHYRHISSPEGLSQYSQQLHAANRDGIARTQSELVSRSNRGNELDFDPRKIPDRLPRLPNTIDDDQATPPGTPPPPYFGSNDACHPPNLDVTEAVDATDGVGEESAFSYAFCLMPDEPPPPPPRMNPCVIAANFEGRPLPPIPSQQNNSPQQGPDCVPPALPPRPLPGQISNIISMEDDEFPSESDNQLDDHGPFVSLWKLLRNPAHLAVFLYYLISNRNPSSLLFYLITESYKEGRPSDMKKWAYEIHSSFLVPESPLKVNNVDGSILLEIDDNLQNNLEKEDELRNIFTKARKLASDELNELLTEFRIKRSNGLAFFGPPDSVLQEAYHDKSKELRFIETSLLPILHGMCEDFENLESKNQAVASALATVLKQLGVKSQQFLIIIDRIPTFVAKDKSRIRFLNKNKKPMLVKEHHFTPQHYCIITYCNHCQFIIWGIGYQGYQCQNCDINIHKNCVKTIEEVCVGQLRQKKDKKKEDRKKDRMSGLMENIISKTRKPSHGASYSNERGRKGHDDGEATSPLEGANEYGDRIPGRPRSKQDPLLDSSPVPGSIAELHNHLSRKGSGPIGRSESFRQRREQRPSFRKRSDPNIPRSKSDVDVDDKVVLNSSQSSSNSSLSTSLDSPSNSLEAVGRNAAGPMTAAKVDEIASSLPTQNSISSPHSIHVQHHVYDDSDLEAEAEAPNWQEGIEWEVVQSMKAKEKNRQDVINELFHTEKTHVRKLKVLESVFYRPMIQEQIASPELIQLLFGNLEEMIEVHGSINTAMKEKKQENPIVADIGDHMLSVFDGPAGENLKRAAASFCKNQSIALDMLKHRQKKDQKLAQFVSEAGMNHLCRRLQLKDIIPTGMQRLTKYPLLLENIAKYTTGAEEHEKVLRAVDCSKSILNYVNQSVKEAENMQRLFEIQKKIDKSPFEKVDHPLSHEFRNLDLSKYKLVHDGVLNWRVNKQKTIDVHLLVLEQFLVLLHKQDDKYVLKFQNPNHVMAKDDKVLLSPILRIENVLIRNKATEKKTFFVVNVSKAEKQNAIYELVARTGSERKSWMKNIQESCDSYKNSLPSKPTPALSERLESSEEPAEPETEQTKASNDLSAAPPTCDSVDPSVNGVNTSEITEKDIAPQNSKDLSPPTPPSGSSVDPGKSSSENASTGDDTQGKTVTNTRVPPTPPASNAGTPSPARRMQRVEILQIAEGPRLIEPSEVVVTQGAVLQTAQPVLTPFEKLRRKDEQIVNALQDKQQLVAGILNVPPEEFENIADIVTEVEGEKEPKELVLSAIVQVNKLTSILNETLRVTEEDTVSASAIGFDEFASANASASRPPKSPLQGRKISRMPGVPTHKLLAVSRILNQQLAELLHVVVERDEEREEFRKELRLSKEQIHLLHESTRRRTGATSPAIHSRPNSYTSVESSVSGDLCIEANAPSDHCSCDIPQSDDESGANISPIQGVIPEIGLAETVQIENNKEECEETKCTQETTDCGETCKEMFVDAPSNLLPETTLLTTDLDCNNEVEINVDSNDCDIEVIVDSIEDSSTNSENRINEQTDSGDNNNITQPTPIVGSMFF